MKRYSGKFVLRLSQNLHQKLAEKAEAGAQSLNTYCTQLLHAGFISSLTENQQYSQVVQALTQKFPSELIGILIFGSQVTGQAFATSDTDFLIVLSGKIPLTRSLYQWWDEQIIPPDQMIWNPQFVHLPEIPLKVGGLWFEIALAHQILWEKGHRVSKVMDQLQSVIASDDVRRYWSNGHPYWVWRNHEKHVALS